jgi:uncharacterized protein
VIGATTGFVIGLTSAGSGTLIAVFLIVLYRMTPRHVVGTDVFHAAILLWAAGIAHIVGGNVDFGLVSLPGVWIGSHLTTTLPTGLLRIALGAVLMISSLALFDKAGVELPLALVLAIPSSFALGLLVQWLARRGRRITAADSRLGSTL